MSNVFLPPLLELLSFLHLLSRLQTICKKSVKHEKHARCDICVWIISRCLFWFMRQISHISNHLAVEAVIMHKKKGFSRTIRDKI